MQKTLLDFTLNENKLIVTMTHHRKPIKQYTEVESDYIKQIINDSPFSDIDQRKKVNKLIRLEQWILGEVKPGYPEGMLYNKLKRENKEDYDKIYQELKPYEYAEEKIEEKIQREKTRKEEEKRKEREKRELEKLEKQWNEVKEYDIKAD